VDSKRLVIRLGAVLEDAKRYLFSQQDRPVGRAAEVYASMNPVTEGDVVRKLVQFSIDVQSVYVRTRVSVKR